MPVTSFTLSGCVAGELDVVSVFCTGDWQPTRSPNSPTEIAQACRMDALRVKVARSCRSPRMILRAPRRIYPVEHVNKAKKMMRGRTPQWHSPTHRLRERSSTAYLFESGAPG